MRRARGSGIGQRRVPKSLALPALLIASLAGAVGASATAQGLGDRGSGHDHAIEVVRAIRLSPPSLVAAGEGWRVEAFRSNRGVCSELTLSGTTSEGCGYDTEIPRRGKTEVSKVAYDVAGSRRAGVALVFGPVSDDVAAVRIELRNGQQYEVKPSGVPAAAGLPRFYAQSVSITRGHELAAVSALGENGEVLERREVAFQATR